MSDEIIVLAVVQARMRSNRLPNKSMLHLHGYPIIEWVYRRVAKATLINRLIMAIPDTKKDDSLAHFLGGLGAEVFRGSEMDLVDRFFQAAEKWNPSDIIRVSADCPFVSGSEIDRLIEFYRSNPCDYAYNHIPKNNRYPDGIGAEIMPFKNLRTVHQEAKEPYDREHVTAYLQSHPERFKISTFDPPDERLLHPEVKLDIDTYRDYENLLRLKVDIDMEAHEIVAAAKSLEGE